MPLSIRACRPISPRSYRAGLPPVSYEWMSAVSTVSDIYHYLPLTRLHPLLQRAPTHLHNNLVPLTLWMVAIETLLDLYLGQVTTHATVDGSLGRRAVSIRHG